MTPRDSKRCDYHPYAMADIRSGSLGGSLEPECGLEMSDYSFSKVCYADISLWQYYCRVPMYELTIKLPNMFKETIWQKSF